MSLKVEIAATIRTLRTLRGAAYEDLAEASARKNLGSLEQGKSNISVETLARLATALDIDPVALLTLAVSIHNDETPETVLSRTQAQIDEFRAAGGIEILQTHVSGDGLVKRSRGKPGGAKTCAAVRALQEEGFSRSHIAERLGLSRSTVWKYWKAT